MNIGKLKNNIFLALCFGIFGIITNAQTIDSTIALKAACEKNPNNTVLIDYPAKISNGADVSLPEQVNTGCTIILAPSGTFETDQVGMNFNGIFSIQSTSQTQVKFVKTLFSANSMNLTTSGNASLIGIYESLLKSDAGDLTLNLGMEGVLEIALPLNGLLNSLESSGAINVSSGTKFTGSVVESQFLAGTGISVSLGGAEGIFKLEKSNLITSNGSVSVSSQGFKSLVEMGFGRISATNGVNVTLPGSEGNLVMQNMQINSGSGSIALDIARIGRVGKIILTGSNLTSGAGISLLASLNGRTGSILVENNQITATNGITIRTGRLGETIVKTNTINSLNSILIRTGIAGNCLVEQNNLIAPSVQSCR